MELNNVVFQLSFCPMTLEYVTENIKNLMLYQLLIIDTLIQFDSCESWNLNHYYEEASNRDFLL